MTMFLNVRTPYIKRVDLMALLVLHSVKYGICSNVVDDSSLENVLCSVQVVRLIKTSPEKPITLAVGDGANDVSMIQEAHVGIGEPTLHKQQSLTLKLYSAVCFKHLDHVCARPQALWEGRVGRL